MSIHYVHDPRFRKNIRLFRLVSFVLPTLAISICAVVGGITGAYMQAPYMAAGVLLCATFLDGNRVSDLIVDREGLWLRPVSGTRSIPKRWQDLTDLKCYATPKRLFGLFPLFKTQVIVLEFGHDSKERYELCEKGLAQFTDLKKRLEALYTETLEVQYQDFDINSSKKFFGQKLWINKGKLNFGLNYTVPVADLRAEIVAGSGATKLVYRYRNGEEKHG